MFMNMMVNLLHRYPSYSFKSTYYQYDSMMNQCLQIGCMEKCVPTKDIIPSPILVNKPILICKFSCKEMIINLLSDNDLMRQKNWTCVRHTVSRLKENRNLAPSI